MKPRHTRPLALALICLCTCGPLRAQDVTPGTPRPYRDEWDYRDLQQEDLDADDGEERYEMMSEWAEHRLDLNTCTREDLERLPFLSAQQVMDIMEYRDRAGRIETPMELRMIPSLDRHEADRLMQFVEIPPPQPADTLPSWRRLMARGRHELMAYAQIPLYTRQGDANGYLGPKYKHWLRYTLSSSDRLKAGLVASQDAGEPFMAGRNKAGYDFYSAYVMLRRMGRLKTLVLGRYRLRMGMGLAINNSFGLGKLNTLSTLGRQGSYVVPHGSRSEARYLQGAAATLRLSRSLDLTAFISWRRIDATLNADSATIRTILTSGYHRTPGEMERRRNASQGLIGTHLAYRREGWHAGATAYLTSLDRALRPDTTQLYRYWYPRGRRFWNVSADYGYTSARLNFSGETAVADGGGVATINSLSYLLAADLAVVALQRYYPYQYHSLYAHSFADGTQVSNESGVYVGARWQPIGPLELTAYFDLAYFAWPRYGVSAQSYSLDHYLQALYRHGPWSVNLRYRLRRRERDNATKSALVWRNEHRARLAVSHDLDHWQWRTQADLALCRQTATSTGYMVSQYAAWQRQGLRIRATAAYFHTHDNDSRLYVYEPGMPYQLSFPSFAGHGLRLALHMRADLSPHLMLCGKIATTRYFDRTTIGTGLQAVHARSLTDVEVQVKWKWRCR